MPSGPPSPCLEPCKKEVDSQAVSIPLNSSSACLSQHQRLGPLSSPPFLGFTTKATGWRLMEKEGGPHLEDFSIGTTTQPLQQVVVVPRVPIKDVGVHEVHSWEPELGLRPGASRASGLECWHLPPHTPCPRLASTGCGLPLPHSRFLPQRRAVQPAPPPVPWALRACWDSLPWDPGDPSLPSGPWTECKSDANYLKCVLMGTLAPLPPFWVVAKNHS